MPQLDFTSALLHAAVTPVPAAVSSSAPDVCTHCCTPFLRPVAAREVDTWHFEVTMLCANCEQITTSTLDDAAASRALIAAHEALSLAIVEDEVGRFGGALQANAIVPDDFGERPTPA
jgi:hypothetical protein